MELNYYRPPGESVNTNILQQPLVTMNNQSVSNTATSDVSKKKKKKIDCVLKQKYSNLISENVLVHFTNNSFNREEVVGKEATAVTASMFGLVPPTEVLDMPVDPNEPTYCVCRQVSYGEMVGCDNTECEIEWFHFGCVGLTLQTKPKGKWYCPVCIEKRKK